MPRRVVVVLLLLPCLLLTAAPSFPALMAVLSPAARPSLPLAQAAATRVAGGSIGSHATQRAIGAWVAPDGDSQLGRVVFLGDETFADFERAHVATTGFMIFFYGDWCGHSMYLKQFYAGASVDLPTAVEPGFATPPFVAVNCDRGRNTQLCTRFLVYSFPHFVWIRAAVRPETWDEDEDGPWEDEEPGQIAGHPYNGGRSTLDFVRFMRKQVQPWWTPSLSRTPSLGNSNTGGGGGGGGGGATAWVSDVGSTASSVTTATTTRSKAAAKGRGARAVALAHADADPEGEAMWGVTGARRGRVELLSDYSFDPFMRAMSREGGPSGRPVAVMFYSEICGPCNAMKPAFSAVSLKLKSVQLAAVNCEAEGFAICKRFQITQYPSIKWFANLEPYPDFPDSALHPQWVRLMRDGVDPRTYRAAAARTGADVYRVVEGRTTYTGSLSEEEYDEEEDQWEEPPGEEDYDDDDDDDDARFDDERFDRFDDERAAATGEEDGTMTMGVGVGGGEDDGGDDDYYYYYDGDDGGGGVGAAQRGGRRQREGEGSGGDDENGTRLSTVQDRRRGTLMADVDYSAYLSLPEPPNRDVPLGTIELRSTKSLLVFVRGQMKARRKQLEYAGRGGGGGGGGGGDGGGGDGDGGKSSRKRKKQQKTK